jgi:protein SCO1/2
MCCDYDPATGRYSMVIRRVMQALGIATVLTLVGLILVLRRSEVKRIRGATQQ